MQLAILDSLDYSMKVAKSNAKLCQTGIVNQIPLKGEEKLLTSEELCADKSAVKFELSPMATKDWANLKPEQKNILFAARNNNLDYIR